MTFYQHHPVGKSVHYQGAHDHDMLKSLEKFWTIVVELMLLLPKIKEMSQRKIMVNTFAEIILSTMVVL